MGDSNQCFETLSNRLYAVALESLVLTIQLLKWMKENNYVNEDKQF